MSLVITLHDADVGIAVSEGRAGWSNLDGTFTPVDENRVKTSYLLGGNIVGCTGDGIVRKLRAEIEAKATTHTFAELLNVAVPKLVAEYRARYPDNIFGVTLMGNDNGRIRSRTWNDRGDGSSWDEDTISTSTLGCDGSTHDEAAAAVRKYVATMVKDYLNLAEAQEALKSIVCHLAEHHNEINNRLTFSYVLAPSDTTAALVPLGDGSVTRVKEIFDLKRFVMVGANNTRNHILTSKATAYLVYLSPTTNVPLEITGLGWTAQAASGADVYNINGLIEMADAQGSSLNVNINVFVDGDTSTDYGSGVILEKQFATMAPFFGTITGLSPGTHTIQVYVTITSGVPSAPVIVQATATCQRIF